jgi:membrane-associated phospholipid phosphatase
MPAAATSSPARRLAAATLVLAAATLALAARPARAERDPLRYDLKVDLALTLSAAAFWGGTEAFKSHLAPTACRLCGTNALDAGARDRLLWSSPERARNISDAIAFGALPAGVAAHALLSARAGGDAWKEGFVDLLVIAEAATLAGSLGQIVKLAAGRQRPFVHYGNYLEANRAPDPDDNLSFWSGHSSLTFSLAVGAGTVSALRGDRHAPWVLGVGLAAAAATGWLRIAGDKHYLTDVLTGAAVGALAGWAVPTWLHRRDGAAPGPAATRVAVTPLPLGIAVVF